MERSIILYIIIAAVLGILIGWGIGADKKKPRIKDPAQSATLTRKEVELGRDMRKLWEDHVTWTKVYINSAVFNLPDADEAATRLLKNQDDLGNAMRVYYGDESADRLTSLLRSHITIATEVVAAAKSNNRTALEESSKRWSDNGDEISDLLSQINPNWNRDEMRAMFNEHLELTTQEAVDIIGRNAQASIGTYDKIHEQILKMSDFLTNGIIKQFPEKF